VQSGAGAVTVNPDQPYRPIPAERGRARRQNFFEFLLRSANPKQVDWGAEIDGRIRNLLDHSVNNPHFRLSTIQLAVIIFLLALCYFWHDKTEKTKQIAAENLTDALNAKSFADRRALEAIDRYNEHIEKCNRAIEAQESGLPRGSAQSDWQDEMRRLQTKLVSAEAEAARLAKQLEDRKGIQAQMEERVTQLEAELQRRKADPNQELVARLHRAEAQLGGKRPRKNGS
jgi:Skp family chaperone for outer membrane proteins